MPVGPLLPAFVAALAEENSLPSASQNLAV
jgi:hypothetical protein